MNFDAYETKFSNDVKTATRGIKAEIERKSNVCQETLLNLKDSLRNLTEDCAGLIENVTALTEVAVKVADSANKIIQQAAKQVGRVKATEHRVDEALKDLKSLGAHTTKSLKEANDKQSRAAWDFKHRLTDLLRREDVIPQ